MKYIKIGVLFLTLILVLSGFVLAQETEEEKKVRERAREVHEKARQEEEKAKEVYDKSKQLHEKSKQAYEKAKQVLYQKDYEQAVMQFEQFIHQYKQSRYAAESYYWLVYSMDKRSREMDHYEDQKAYQKEAIRYKFTRESVC